MEKLVRDRIPEIVAAAGRPDTPCRTASEKEFPRLLEAKLREETEEYLQSSDPAELADILEVVYALGRIRGESPSDLERRRGEKAAARGGFARRLVMDFGGGPVRRTSR